MNSLVFGTTMIILTLVSIVSSDDLVNCRLKKGCHITKCDPTPWLSSNSDIESQVDRNEYPITCKEKKSGLSTDALTILSTLSTGGGSKQGQKGEVGDPGRKGDPGKRGARGSAGSSGSKGQKGDSGEEFDKDLIETLSAENKQLKSKISRLDRVINTLKKNQDKSGKILDCLLNGAKVGSKCFFVEVYHTRDTDVYAAEEICKNKGGRMADITTRQEYEAIMDNMRNKIPEGEDSVSIWTGMKRDKDGNAVLSDGKIAPYKEVRTHPGDWTRADDSLQTHAYLLVLENYFDSNQGLAAVWMTRELNGVLCSLED